MNQLPNEYGYVIGAIGFSHFMNFFLASRVISARKKYNCDYPNLYLQKDDKNSFEFNSI